jgi:amino acid adenylation domain-containing protein
VDFASAEAPADEAALEWAVAAAAAAPFDLERGPLVRARLWRRRRDAVLVLAVHHAVVDFWSLELILVELGRELARELARPSAADAAGEEAAEEEAGAADDALFLAFARRQERLLAGPAGRALEAWWRGELAAAPEALELPVDRPRAPTPSHRGSSVEVPLGAGTSAAVAAVAAAAGTTPFAVLVAAWQAVLARTSGTAEVMVGCAAAGRTSELAAAVGHFVNLLPLRGRLADDPSFGALVARTGRGLAAALAHQDLPFPRIVELAAPRRDPARHPLVQAGVVLEVPRRLPATGLAPFVLGGAGGHLSLGPLELASLPLPRRTVQLEVLLTAVEAPDRLVAALDYATDLFDPTTAERLARHLATLLAAATAAPDERVSRLAMLDDGERRQALGLDRAVPPTEPPAVVPAAFLDHARRRPGAPAVLWRRDDGVLAALSYGELAVWSGELAARLAAAGVRGETRVGILLGREPARVAAVLAVLAAGGCCVAIEPDEPPRRVERLLRRAGVEVLITSGAAAEAAPEGRWWRLHPGAGPAGSAAETAAAPAPEPEPIGELAAWVAATPAAAPTVDPEAAAYVVFTSGSTGEPKGVVVPHRAIAAFVAAAAGDVAAGPGARVLHLASLAFDISLGELLLPLASGGAVCLAGADDRRTGAGLAAAVEAFGATTWITTPSVLSLVPADRELTTLATLVLGGEPAPAALAARWGPGRRLFNGYGPAEATVYASRRRCPADEPERIRDLGEAMPGSRMALLGRWLEPVPPGTVGELALSGAALARGYLRDPRTTAERFLPDPWSPAPGARLYRSGDLARRRSGVGLELVGRRDAQLKVRGVRMEPGEVETALVRHPAVARAAVAARGERLVAWWVPESGGPPPSAADLRAFLAASLPAPLVPSRLLAVAALPLTATGKVDRAALVEPAAAVAAAPRGDLERRLGRLWCEELGVEAVDVETTFFELGGHSLALARIHARLVEELGREVAISDLFSHPTVASLAAHLSAAERATARPPGGAGPVETRGAGRGEARRAGLAGLAAQRRARPAAATVRGDPASRSDE